MLKKSPGVSSGSTSRRPEALGHPILPWKILGELKRVLLSMDRSVLWLRGLGSCLYRWVSRADTVVHLADHLQQAVGQGGLRIIHSPLSTTHGAGIVSN